MLTNACYDGVKSLVSFFTFEFKNLRIKTGMSVDDRTTNLSSASDLLSSFSTGGRAGRTYMSSSSLFFTLERLGTGALLQEDHMTETKSKVRIVVTTTFMKTFVCFYLFINQKKSLQL